MNEPSFTNREIDAKFKERTDEMKEHMDKLITPLTVQVTKTNGRVTKMERNLLIIACVVGTYMILNYPKVIEIIQIFI